MYMIQQTVIYHHPVEGQFTNYGGVTMQPVQKILHHTMYIRYKLL